MTITHKLALVATITLLSPSLAFGYLDPGTGSLLLSSVIALIASGVFFFKSVFYKLIALINGGGEALSVPKSKITL